MNVKGVSLINLMNYVKKSFPDRVELWRNALPDDSRKIVDGVVVPSSWYPVEAALIQPTETVCKVFFTGSREGAWQTGAFNADTNLTGIYQLFIKIGTPRFLLEKGGAIAQKMYDPSPTISLVDYKTGWAKVHYFNDHCKHWVLECRIAGFCKRGLELSGCSDVKIEFTRYVSRGDPYSETILTWK